MPAVFSSGATSNSSKAKNSNLFGSGSSKGTYSPPAPVYTPPQKSYSQEYYYEPEPVYTPPKATYTPPKNTYVAPKPVAPAPSPVKTAVQQIIDKAITAPKPAPAPVPNPMETALKAQTATVTPWLGSGQPGVQPTLYRQATQAGARNELADANLLYDLDNLNAQIALAQDLQNQNQAMPGVYIPGSESNRDYGNLVSDLIDKRGELLSPGNTGLSGSLSTISNTGGDILTGAWTGLEDGLGLGNQPWSPRADQAGQVYGDGTGGPSYIGNPPTTGNANVAMNRQPQGMPPAPDPYETGTLFWDPITQTPIRVYPDDVGDFYNALYGLDQWQQVLVFAKALGQSLHLVHQLGLGQHHSGHGGQCQQRAVGLMPGGVRR